MRAASILAGLGALALAGCASTPAPVVMGPDVPASLPAMSVPLDRGGQDSATPATPAVPGQDTAQPAAPAYTGTLPKVGECQAYPDGAFWSLDAPPVDCAKAHTGLTVYTVAEANLPFSFETAGAFAQQVADGGGLENMNEDSKTISDMWNAGFAPHRDACVATITDLLGAKLPDGSLASSRFAPVLTGPSEAEWTAGARWIRCDVAAELPAGPGRAEGGYLDLPGDLDGILTRAEALPYLACYYYGQGGEFIQPGCQTKDARENAWLATAGGYELPDEPAWSSDKELGERASSLCQEQVGAFTKDGATGVDAEGWTLFTDPVTKAVSEPVTKDQFGTDGAQYACAVSAKDWAPYHG